MRFSVRGNKSISDFFKARDEKIWEEVDSINVLTVDENQLALYLKEKFELKTIKLGKITSQVELTKKMGEASMNVKIEIPFQGPREYFAYNPSSYTILDEYNVYIKGSGSGENQQNVIIIDYNFDIEIDENQMNFEINRIKDYVIENVSHYNTEINSFNKSIERRVRHYIEKKKSTLTKYEHLVKTIEIPLKKRDETLPIIPIKRKKITIKPPSPKIKKVGQDPRITKNIYEDILGICAQMSLAMARAPSIFEELGEEDIRNFFLVILNAFFEGETTGETFNGEGRADIVVRYKKENAFIVECKVWRGPKYISESIDQLFKYVTWHDTKTGIFIFNKERETSFTNVLQKVDSIVNSNSKFIKEYIFQNEILIKEHIKGYKFRHPKDELKEFYLTIMAFNIPKIK